MDKYKSLFILGNPRSGTSLLRIMLDNHSQISIPPEAGFIQWWSGKYGNWKLQDSMDDKKVNSYLLDLSSSRKIETWKLNYKSLGSIIKELRPKNYTELSRAVILQYARQNGKNSIILGDKNNYYLQHLEVLKQYFPKTKFLAIIRDGRDVACSYLDLNKLETDSPYKPVLPTSIDLITEEWNLNNNKISNFFKSLNRDQYMWVKYEDLIIKTEETLDGVCDFLNLKFDSQMLEYYKNKNEPLETMAWKKKTRTKPDASNIGVYKTRLQKEDILNFNKECKTLLNIFNYEM